MKAAQQTTTTALPYQLSSAQRRTWFRQQATAGERTESVIEFCGSVDKDRWRVALEQVVCQEEIFRTRFLSSEPPGPVLAAVDCEIQLEWQEHYLPDFGSEHELLQQESVPRNLRCFWIENLNDGRKRLILDGSSLLIDGWSMKNLTTEIALAYTGQNPVARTPFSAFANWEQKWMDEQDGALAGRRYWREQEELGRRAGKMTLTRRDAGSKTWKWEDIPIPLDLTERLEHYCVSCGVSLRDLVLSAWIILLSRHFEGEVVVIERWGDGRPLEEMSSAVGLFGSWLPLAIDTSLTPRFRDLAARVSDLARTSDDWAEWYQPSLSGAGNPRIGFRWHAYPRWWRNGDLEFFIQSEQPRGYDVDLVLDVAKAEDEPLTIRSGYREDHFAAADVQALGRQLIHLLYSSTLNGEQRLCKLQLPSEAERAQLVDEWNRTEQEYGPEEQVQELFEQQVADAGAAIAVICNGDEISYEELNRRANQLARYLRKHGVECETRVGLYMEQSVEMVVSMLAVLKSGGVYVPLDPAYPEARLNYMLQDSRAGLVIVGRRANADRLGLSSSKLVLLTAIKDELVTEIEENLGRTGTRANLAYVLYTSGSTGRPKGVMVNHGGLLNYLNWCRTAYSLNRGGRTPVHSPLGFDLTVTSLIGPLISGGAVELIERQTGVEGLAQALRTRSDYMLVKVTPSHLELLMRSLENEPVGGRVRALVIGGEALRPEIVRWWQKAAPQTRLINEYGPTEAVVGCCVYEVGSAEDWREGVPIGRPIANTQLYVLNQEMDPVAIGQAGELYIGGAGVARGYWDQPELTAERFVPNPFGARGERLYRTGDRALWKGNGQLEYLGREDEQVKLRGYRIEPGEIESVLREHGELREAAVVLAGEGAQKTLVAYVVKRSGSRLDRDELRDWAKQQLPEYMVPGRWIWMEELHLTAHGKLDRSNLPASVDDLEESKSPQVSEASGETEQLIANIWKEVLQTSRIGLDDNFFDIGGNSMLLIECHLKIQEAFRANIPVVEMFNSPTVRMLAHHLQATRCQILPEIDTVRLQRRKQAAHRQTAARLVAQNNK